MIALLDANILHPAALRDLLIRLSQKGLFEGRWTEQILDECFHSIKRRRPDLAPEKLERTRVLMGKAIRNVLVSGYEHLQDNFVLPDLDDHHVLAAAIHCDAKWIVSDNIKDFPTSVLHPLGIEVIKAGDFLVYLFEQYPEKLRDVVQAQADALKKPPTSYKRLLEVFERENLKRFAKCLSGIEE